MLLLNHGYGVVLCCVMSCIEGRLHGKKKADKTGFGNVAWVMSCARTVFTLSKVDHLRSVPTHMLLIGRS